MKRNENFSWLRRSFEVKASCAIILGPPKMQVTHVTYERDTQSKKQGSLDSELGIRVLNNNNRQTEYVHSLANVYTAS